MTPKDFIICIKKIVMTKYTTCSVQYTHATQNISSTVVLNLFMNFSYEYCSDINGKDRCSSLIDVCLL